MEIPLMILILLGCFILSWIIFMVVYLVYLLGKILLGRSAKPQPQVTKSETPLVDYKNILNQHGGPTSKQARDFLELHKTRDAQFQKRIRTLNKLYLIRKI